MQDMLLESLQRFLSDNCSAADIRRYERGDSTAELWRQLDAFGYADALRSEDIGGAGLGLREVRALIVLLGHFATPVPLAETMLARALLELGANSIPAGPIVLASPVHTEFGEWLCSAVPSALSAEFVLIEQGSKLQLISLKDTEVTATGVQGSLAADIRWSKQPPAIVESPPPPSSLRTIAATLHAAQMVGAISKVLDMTLEYAGLRKQFGRSLAQFQAIQQQLAVMAEQALAADMAVQMAFDEAGLAPQPLRAALAKQSVGAAASQIVAIAHAVHGAIGLSEEYDLQLYSRRLYEWRLADGSESYWAQMLGSARISVSGNSVDFIRQQL